jgi:hypothetical protein
MSRYLDQYQKPPEHDPASGEHFQEYLEELRRFETKIYVRHLKGPLFSPPAATREWKKKVRSLQRLSARKVGQSFNCGIHHALEYLQHFPCPMPVIQLTHRFINMSSLEWSLFLPVERFFPWLDPSSSRIRRVCNHYRALYPEVDDEDVEDLLTLSY